MIALLFTIYLVTLLLLDMTWGLILPGWVMTLMLIAYSVILWAEFEDNPKVKGVWIWLRSRFNSQRS